MAVVLPHNCHKPFSVIFHPLNPTSHTQKSLAHHNHRSTFNTPIRKNCHRQRLFPIVNASDKDSDQNTAQDSEGDSIGVKAALSMLRFYKREISPLLPKSCRYVPTCSEYSMIAYKKYGVAKGTILTAWRLCRCNPLGGSGFDPPRWFDEPPPEQ